MKLLYNLLAFTASLLRVIDEDLLSEIEQYDPLSVFECFRCFQRNQLIYCISFKI